MLKAYEFNPEVVTQKAGAKVARNGRESKTLCGRDAFVADLCARTIASAATRTLDSPTILVAGYSALNSSRGLPVASSRQIRIDNRPFACVEQLRHGS